MLFLFLVYINVFNIIICFWKIIRCSNKYILVIIIFVCICWVINIIIFWKIGMVKGWYLILNDFFFIIEFNIMFLKEILVYKRLNKIMIGILYLNWNFLRCNFFVGI